MKLKKTTKRLAPSYEEGELRDKSIEQMQESTYAKSDLHRLVVKAVQAAPKKPSAKGS